MNLSNEIRRVALLSGTFTLRSGARITAPLWSLRKMRTSRLLADGRDRLLSDTDLQAELDLALADIEAKYAPRLKEAGFIRRLKLRRQMRREIGREIEQRAPSAALYLRAWERSSAARESTGGSWDRRRRGEE